MKFMPVVLIASLLFYSCTESKGDNWKIQLNDLGTYSSPRVADLNQDGTKDIIMGAGGKEDHHSDSTVIALDGKTGRVLWTVPGVNQFVGSAVFQDITQDGIPDVFIGGRWAELVAVNGSTGKVIWRFFPERKSPDPSAEGWFNFTSASFIPDQDRDNIPDLLISNGGNAQALADDTNRPAGKLLILSGSTGKMLASVTVPDGRETYMSVVCAPSADQSGSDVLYGTGGETMGGHLYRTTLKNIMLGDISQSTILATSELKGFVAPPVYVDITNDGNRDIIVNVADGRMMALDGHSDTLIWQVLLPGTEAYTTPAVGLFNNDNIPDFFCNFAIGVFPNLPKSVRFMVDGKTGVVEYRDTIPAFQYASPVAADLDGDGFDEGIVNQGAVKRKQFENVYYSYLHVFDFIHKKNYAIGDTVPATNFASTPWVGDLDEDGYFDVIYASVNFNDVRFDLGRPLGLFVNRFRSGIRMRRAPAWGAYMGSRYDGLYEPTH